MNTVRPPSASYQHEDGSWDCPRCGNHNFQAEISVTCENVVHQSQEEQINENADGEIVGMKVTTVTGSIAHRRPTGHHDQQYLETRVPGGNKPCSSRVAACDGD